VIEASSNKTDYVQRDVEINILNRYKAGYHS